MTAELAPGDLGRAVIHDDPEGFAMELAGWCDDDGERSRIIAWLQAVVDALLAVVP